MKRTLDRMFRSGLSVVIALCLVIGALTPALAMRTAAAETEINYVSLGDSMANGYGLTNYGNNGYRTYGEESYTNAFAAWLIEAGYASSVNHIKLAMSAMRAEDLHFILEYGTEGAFPGDYYTWDEFTDGRFKNDCGGVDAAAAMYRNAVKEADIISLGIGNANFGVFMLGRITNALGVLGGNSAKDAWIEVEKALAECDDETRETALEVYADLKAELMAYVPADKAELADKLATVMTYAVVSYMLNYAGVIEAIATLNPDAEVMLVGLMNTLYGLSVEVEYEGEKLIIDLGDIMGDLIDTMNAYIAALPAAMQAAGKYAEAKFYFAAAPEVEMIVDTLADEIVKTNNVVRDRTIEEVCDMVFPMLNAMTEAAGDGSPYVELTRADVEAYEAAYAAGAAAYLQYIAANGASKAQSVATYLAFEKATVSASELDVLNGSAFVKLVKGLDDVFSGVFDAFFANLYAPTAENAEHMAYANAVSAAAGGYVAADTVYALVALPDAMGDALVADETVYSLLNLFARMLIGNGIGCHPSAAGHEVVAAAVIEAYATKHTVQDETLENIEKALKVAYDLILEYYDDAYAYAYDYAEENGYIAEAVAAIDELIAALKAIETVPGTEAFQAKVAAEIAEVIEALEAAKALLLEADVLDQATLDALVALLDESADAMYGLIDVLVQAGVDVNQLAIIPALKAAHATLLNEVIPAIVKNLEEAVKAGTEYLLEKAEEAYEALVDAAIAAIKMYAPMVDEALYDYLYNNPEEVISFFKTYGPVMLDLADEYGDEALAVVLYALSIYGEDIATYIIENPETVIAAVAKWWNTYGDRIIAITQVYAEALGLCDAVRDQVAELEAKLNAAITELIVLKAELEAKIAELEAKVAELEAKIAELEAKINAEVEAVIAKIKAEIAKIEAEIAKIEAEIAKIKAEIAKVEADITNINDALAAIDGQIAAAVEALIAAFEAACLNATTADYEIDKDSYYVALGDGSAASMSYVDALAAELGIDYKNLADAALTIDDVLATIEANAADISAADLITIGYGNTAFTHDAVAQMMAVLSGEAAKEYDWAALVGEEGVPYVELALAEVYAYIIDNGMDADLGGVSVADVLMAAVEAYAYGAVSYAVNLPKAIEAIRDINSDAVVVIVGMHNAFRGTVLEFEGATIEFSSILDKFVEGANIYGTALCMITGDAIFVEAPEVETGVSDQTIGVLEFLMSYIMNPDVLNATANGHEYVKTQILNALNITVVGLLGDVDGNGVVNSKDAMLVAQYYAGVEVEIDLSVADVDGNGYINSKDAMQIAQYYAGVIAEFPAA